MKKLFFISICVVLSLSVSAMAKTILLIESYHAEYAWDMNYIQGIRQVVGDAHEIVMFQMDTKRVPLEQYTQKAEEAWNKYMEVKPDLVILGDDNALKFLGPKFEKMQTPVVFLGINHNPRKYIDIKNRNFSGVLERPLLKRSIIFMSKMVNPRIRKLLILFDSGQTSKASVSETFRGKSTLNMSGMEIHLKMIGDLSTWKSTVLKAKEDGYDALVLGAFFTLVDDEGKHVDSGEILRWSSENTPVPPFCYWDNIAGKDAAIGGLVLYGKDQGIAAAKMAMEILSGKTPWDFYYKTHRRDRYIAPERGRFLFSKTQLKKWKIKLPEKIASEAKYIE